MALAPVKVMLAAINGVIAEKGREVAVAAPTHVKLIEAVKRVEHREIPPRPENLHGI